MTVLQQFIIIGMVVPGDCADTFPALPAFPRPENLRQNTYSILEKSFPLPCLACWSSTA